MAADPTFNDYTTQGGSVGGVGNLGPTFTQAGVTTTIPGNTNTFAAGTGGNKDLAEQVIKATFDRAIAWKARTEPMYRSFANIRPGSLVHPGTGIDMFRFSKDLEVVEAPLDELKDPDAVPLTAPEKVTLVANEYGNATVTTLRLKEYAWTDIDPVQVELVARNMRDSIDLIYKKAIYAQAGGFSQQKFGDGSDVGANAGFQQLAVTGTAPNGVLTAGAAPTAGLNAHVVRQIVAHFRNNDVPTYSNGLYLGLITPDAAIKLREGTDVAGWRYPHLDGSQSGAIWNNTVGIFEGVQFLESHMYAGMTPGKAAPVAADEIKATAAIQNLLFMGASSLAEVVIREPGAAVMPQVDRFNRYFGLGWYGFLGAGIYDPQNAVKVAVNNV